VQNFSVKTLFNTRLSGVPPIVNTKNLKLSFSKIFAYPPVYINIAEIKVLC
jgi:hypothetical protein